VSLRPWHKHYKKDWYFLQVIRLAFAKLYIGVYFVCAIIYRHTQTFERFMICDPVKGMFI